MSDKPEQSREELAAENELLRARLKALERTATGGQPTGQAPGAIEIPYRLLAENIQDVLWTMDLNLAYTYVSPSVEKLRGYTVEEVMAQRMDEAVAPGSLEYARETFAEALRDRDAPARSESMEIELNRKDGSTVWTEIVVTFVRDDDGIPVQILGVTRDITERRHSEEMLRIASRMEATATLAGGIAHNFNNLMATVLGNAAVIRAQLADDHAYAPMLQDIEEAAERAGLLSEQILAFARGGKYEQKPLDLNRTVRDVLDLQRGSLPPRIRLIDELAPEVRSVSGDPTQMALVILSLCQNAIEAIDAEGTLRVTSGDVEIDEAFAEAHLGMRPGPCVAVTVEDSGHGMDEETLSKVFEPYFTTKAHGRGLGLAAAYGIVKNHNGYIYAESRKGEGAVFRIFLPAIQVACGQSRPVQSGLPIGTETVLVVDDEDMVVAVTKRILELFGYQVVCASNGREAVEIARTFPGEIQAAVLDLAMPVMGGAEAFPLLKKARPRMKVIVCSGYELDETSQTLLDAGASAFLHKPFRPEQLGIEIRRALDG